MYQYKPIDEARDDFIGLTITDIEPKGRVVYLEDSEGRSYVIDNTGEDGAVCHKGYTESESLEMFRTTFELLLEHLDVDEDELWEKYYK